MKRSLELGMCQPPGSIALKHYQVRIDKWKQTNHTSVQSMLIIHKFSKYFQTCLLKCVCNPKINIQRGFAIICRQVHTHSSEKTESPHMQVPG